MDCPSTLSCRVGAGNQRRRCYSRARSACFWREDTRHVCRAAGESNRIRLPPVTPPRPVPVTEPVMPFIVVVILPALLRDGVADIRIHHEVDDPVGDTFLPESAHIRGTEAE